MHHSLQKGAWNFTQKISMIMKDSHDKCPYKATLESSLLIHMKSIHLGIRYPCDLCSYNLTTKGSLVGHKKLVHGKPKKLKCDFCEFETIKKYPKVN
jgi:hypothetical protein